MLLRTPSNRVSNCESAGMTPAPFPKHILVVDDAPYLRDLIMNVLRAAGHEVAAAVDGRDGLVKFREGTWDVVLTDMQMPNMNGEEMAALMKREAPGVRVIMMTGSQEIVSETGIFDAVLGKPFRAQDVLRLIAEMTSQE